MTLFGFAKPAFKEAGFGLPSLTKPFLVGAGAWWLWFLSGLGLVGNQAALSALGPPNLQLRRQVLVFLLSLNPSRKRPNILFSANEEDLRSV